MIVIVALLLAAATVALLAAARRAGGAWARWVLRLGAVVVALPMLFVVAIVVAHLRNDRRLARFAAQLDDFPLPSGARVVHRHAAVGILTGNGDHCDFLARHEIVTPLSLESVRSHYERLQLRPAIEGGADGNVPFVSVEPRTGGGYIVTAIDAPYYANLDDRCH